MEETFAFLDIGFVIVSIVFLCNIAEIRVALVVLAVVSATLVEIAVLLTFEPFFRNLFVPLDETFVMVLRQKSDNAIQFAITGGI